VERAGNADARVPRYYAQFYESASEDEDVDVTGASVQGTQIDESVMDSFHVDVEGQPLDHSAT
jgi:hypothetical protein